MLVFYYATLLVNIGIVFTLLQSDLKRYSPASIFWFAILAAFLVPAIPDPFVGYVRPHIYSVEYMLDIETLIAVQMFVLVFLLFFSGVYLLTRLAMGKTCATEPRFLIQIRSNNPVGLYWLLGFLSLSLYGLIESYKEFGVSLFSDFGFIARRENISALSGFLLSYNLIICGGVFFWLLLQRRMLASCFVLGLYLLLYFVMGGSRQPIVILMLPFLIYFLASSNNRLVYSILLVVFFNFFSRGLEFLLYLRNLPGLDARIAAISNSFDILFSQEKIASSESSLRFAFYYFVQNGASAAGFGEFTYLVRTFFFWLPSAIDVFDIKPDDFEYVMFEFYMPGYTGTMHPTFFGSIYADGGWMMLPWAIFFITIYKLTAPILNKYNGACFFAIWGLYAYFYMMLARGAIYGPLVALVFGLVLVGVIQSLSSHLNHRNSTR